MKNLLLILFGLIFYGNSIAQRKPINLVPNSSFEELRNLPLKRTKRPMTRYEPTSGYIPFQSNLNYWFKGTETTPDLRITKVDLYKDCARQYDDCDQSRTGVKMAGLMTFLQNTYMDDYREYLQIKLKKPLKVGVTTFVEFWICKERKAKLVSNNIGCYFSRKKVFKKTEGPMHIKPQINCDSLVNPLEKKWIKIERSFIPDQTFAFVTIGNFYGNEKTDTMTFEAYTASPHNPPYAYYLIDDVQIWQEESVEEAKLEVGTPIVLENIFFENGKAELTDESFPALNKLVALIKKEKNHKIEISGHTDNVGQAKSNQLLSESRAKAVYYYLIENGIDKDILSYKGLGELQPVATNDTDEGRQINRRVEFVVRE